MSFIGRTILIDETSLILLILTNFLQINAVINPSILSISASDSEKSA